MVSNMDTTFQFQNRKVKISLILFRGYLKGPLKGNVPVIGTDTPII